MSLIPDCLPWVTELISSFLAGFFFFFLHLNVDFIFYGLEDVLNVPKFTLEFLKGLKGFSRQFVVLVFKV